MPWLENKIRGLRVRVNWCYSICCKKIYIYLTTLRVCIIIELEELKAEKIRCMKNMFVLIQPADEKKISFLPSFPFFFLDTHCCKSHCVIVLFLVLRRNRDSFTTRLRTDDKGVIVARKWRQKYKKEKKKRRRKLKKINTNFN